MKEAGNKHWDGEQGEDEVIWANERKRKFINHLLDRISDHS